MDLAAAASDSLLKHLVDRYHRTFIRSWLGALLLGN
jgi:hypothetical protein